MKTMIAIAALAGAGGPVPGAVRPGIAPAAC
jgi:hypothetical protein